MPNGEVIQTWSGAMNTDFSKSVQPKDTYLNAKNLRLITLSGQSNFTIENIKGNSLSFNLPDVTGLYKISSDRSLAGSPNSKVIINGIIVNLGTVVGEFQGLANALNNPIISYFSSATFLANYIALGLKAAISADGESIFITSINGSVITTLTATGSALFNITLILNGDANLIPIGFTTIRDDIYIFSTNVTNVVGGNGQIFKLTYDKITFVATITLIYYAELNFTTQHPIPPSAAEGRYENTNIQRLYWTDNFNPPRNINTQDPNLIALDVSLINSQPQLDLSIPILQQIIPGGGLLVGTYQAAYRLKKNGGATTNFSQLSNQVYIVNNIDESTNKGGVGFKDYVSQIKGTDSGKAIIWKINNLDPDYDVIELALVFRDVLNGSPVSQIIKEESLDGSGTIILTVTGEETTITTITLNEIITSSIYISKVKTLGTKDNRLFYGNISTISKELAEFDSRSYRFDNASNAVITGIGATTLVGPTPAYTSVIDEADAINANTTTQKYKVNGTTIGGEGQNISYEFGTYIVYGDGTVEVTANQIAPYRNTGNNSATSVNLGVVGQDYPTNSINVGMKYPYMDSIFKTYKREETYRFAIQFFDKGGSPMFSKWIGDIKMPSMFDVCPANNRLNLDGSVNTHINKTTGGAITDFRVSYVATDDNSYIQIPYIKFTVGNLFAIANQIGGYSIVRCERKDSDKTILGQGIMHEVYDDGSTTSLWMPKLATYPYLTLPEANSRTQNATIQIPEFLFNGFPGLQSGDTLKIVSILDRSNAPPSTITPVSGVGTYEIEKMYTMSEAATEYTLTQASEIGFGNQTVSVNSGTNLFYRNYDNTTANTSNSVGSKALFIEVTPNIPFNAYGADNQADPRKLLVEYRRNVTNQYGGNTFNARASNSYIWAGHFQPTTNSSTTFTTRILGGDIFTNIFDNQRAIKAWTTTQTGGRGVAGAGRSLTDFFPTETTVNTELRYGIHVNKNLLDNTGSSAETSAYYETFDYNNVFDNEPNLKFYNPKPATISEVLEFDTRFYASEIKINGEGGDSWTLFKPNNYWDVEGSYGPVNAMTILKDKMLFWQNRSFGILSINPVSLTTDSAGNTLQLGIGNIIQRHDYISTEIGCKHQWGITKSSNSAFWFDINNKKFYKYSISEGINPLSDLKGMASYFHNNLNGNINTIDNPIYNNPSLGINGITCVYDFRFNEAIFTFLDKNTKFTIAYNEQINAFTGFYDYTPGLYITDHKQIFSPDPSHLNKIYLHENGAYCSFYGTIYDSTLKFIINELPQNTKVFDNFEWLTEALFIDANNNLVNINDETWKEIRVYDDYQNSNFVLLDPLSVSPNIKRRERTWKLAVPRNKVLYISSNSPDIFTDLSVGDKLFPERMRDKYLTVDLSYNNLNNYEFRCHFVKNIYRISDR